MHDGLEKTCIIYCRVSSYDQIEGTSLETQERLCRDYAERQGIEVLAVFIERGESAKTANRTELNRALVYCSRHKHRVSYFLVYKLDRFARNQDDHVTVRAMLNRSGTELRSVTEPIDNSPIGRAMEGVLSVFAEFDNNVRIERTKAGMLARMRQGFWCWPPPLGYHRPAPGANIAPDPATAPLVRYGFEQFARGFLTYRALAQLLEERGLRTLNGKKIYYQTVEKMIKNPLYCGIMEVWGERHQGSFVPIISEELWNQCQERFQIPSPHAAARAANNPLFPLRKLVICATCKAPLTGSCSVGKRGRKYPYYHHWNRACTTARFIRKKDLEAQFVALLRRIQPTPEAAETWRLVIADRLRERASDRRAQYGSLDRELDTLKLERHRIFEYHRSGVYSDDDFRGQLAVIDGRIRRNSLLREEKADEVDLSGLIEKAVEEFQYPAGKWLELKGDYQRRLRLQERIFAGSLEHDGSGFVLHRTPDLRRIYRINWESQGDLSKLAPLIRKHWDEIVHDLRRWYQDLLPP